jgi:small subunit ribosomal protein S1
MSWTRKISHPSNVLKKGEEIEAVVLSVDPARKRVALGLKQLEPDPWQTTIVQTFQVNQRIEGTVTKLTSFGAFVEIGEDLEGLLHVSEMAEEKVEKPEAVVKVGDTIEVKIINIDTNERKIGLSIKALSQPDITMEQEQAEPAQRDPEAPATALAGALEKALAEREEREAGPQEAEDAVEVRAAPAETEEPEAAPESEAAVESTDVDEPSTQEAPAAEPSAEAAAEEEPGGEVI